MFYGEVVGVDADVGFVEESGDGEVDKEESHGGVDGAESGHHPSALADDDGHPDDHEGVPQE